MSKQVLGVDISKAKFDVAILLGNKVKTKKFINKTEGFVELIEWLKQKKMQDVHVCMEATGAYYEGLATYLFDTGFLVSVVNPAQIKGFGQSELSRTKTDRADAQLIARFCLAMNPGLWRPKPAHIRELQDLVRRFESLQDLYNQEYNRYLVSSGIVQESISTMIAVLEKEMKAIKQKFQEHIDSRPDLRGKSELLETIPGVGEATIAKVLAFFGNVEDFKNAKQVAAFVGLNPKHRQSGTSVHGRSRMSKVGDSSLRKSFYLPAITAKRYNPVIKNFCEKLKKAGKPKMLIIGAAMRKLVHIIYGVLKSGEPFSENLATV